MDDRFDALVAYLRGRKPLSRGETAAMYADYLETIRPIVEGAESVPVRRGPGRPRKVESEVPA